MRINLITIMLLAWSNLFGATPGSVDVIVRFKNSQDHIGQKRLESRGAVHKRSLDLVDAHVYTVSSQDLALLAADPEVEYVGLDHPLQATQKGVNLLTQPDFGWMTALGVSSPSATLAWDGTGIGVAIIDSGIVDGSDFAGSAKGKSRIVYEATFVAGAAKGPAGVADAYGHGTMVAGLVGGNGSQSTGGKTDYTVRGIAPNVNIINLRVLDDNGSSTDSTVIAAIQAAILLKNTYNIRVINLSLGRPVFSSYKTDPLCLAVHQAWNAGIVVVVAAGNNGRDNLQGNAGYATITAPGNSPYVITVGAMNTLGTLGAGDDKITSYSSKGPTLLDHIVKPDLVAPGNRIVSIKAPKSALVGAYPDNTVAETLYETGNSTAPSSAYFELSGTSLAAPMVSGAAALLLQQDPTLTPDQVKARLMKTASKLPLVSTSSTDPVTGVTYVSQNDIFTQQLGSRR